MCVFARRSILSLVIQFHYLPYYLFQFLVISFNKIIDALKKVKYIREKLFRFHIEKSLPFINRIQIIQLILVKGY